MQPGAPEPPARDASARLLRRPGPGPGAPRAGARPMAHEAGGAPVVDDSTLDRPRAREIGSVTRRRSGPHKAVARGIGPIAPARADGGRITPVGHRVDDEAHGGPTEDDHLLAMLAAAAARGLEPGRAAFDGRHPGPEGLKAARDLGRAPSTRPGGAASAATRASLRPEHPSPAAGVSRCEAKASIVRAAVRGYVARPPSRPA